MSRLALCLLTWLMHRQGEAYLAAKPWHTTVGRPSPPGGSGGGGIVVAVEEGEAWGGAQGDKAAGNLPKIGYSPRGNRAWRRDGA